MPQARRKSFSHKKSKSTRVTGGDPNAPSKAQWDSNTGLTSYGKFHIQDEEGEMHKFCVGNIARIVPHDNDPLEDIAPYNYWLGKIRSVKSKESEPDEVFAQVQWFYSPSEAASVVKSFPAKACGRFERLISDHYDIVSTNCFQDVVPMFYYNEADLEPPYIPPDEFFYRYEIEPAIARITPAPSTNTCICRQPYNPHSWQSIMHFCPRPRCRIWYHDTCLTRHNHTRQDSDCTTTEWNLKLLNCSPDSNDPRFSALPQRPEDDSPSKKKLRMKRESTPDSWSPAALLRDIPPDLRAIAQCPIVKGAKVGAIDTIIGNVCEVVKARRLVYNALNNVDEMEEELDGWEKDVNVKLAQKAMQGLGLDVGESTSAVTRSAVRPLKRFMCPKCGSAI